MRPRLTVHVDLPTLQDHELRTVARYGVSSRVLRSSWRNHVWWVLYLYAGIQAVVVVRRHRLGEPRWIAGPHCPPTVPWVAVESAWLSTVAAVCMLDAAARGRMRGQFQAQLPGTGRTR